MAAKNVWELSDEVFETMFAQFKADAVRREKLRGAKLEKKMEVLTTLKLELVRQEGRWEACEGCPAYHDPHTKGTLCNFLSNKATKEMGDGWSSCGGGATWRIAK